MTSKDLLEQDYIKICPECGDLASKDSDICENCNHDLSQEPLYDTNDFSEIKRIAQDYKNRVVEDDVEEDIATEDEEDNSESEISSNWGCIFPTSIIIGILIALGIESDGFSTFNSFNIGLFLIIFFFSGGFILLILSIIKRLFKGSTFLDNSNADTNKPNDPIENSDPNAPISCPECGCTQLSANKKGFSYWTGAIGSQKVYITCLRCGHRWKAGDRR